MKKIMFVFAAMVCIVTTACAGPPGEGIRLATDIVNLVGAGVNIFRPYPVVVAPAPVVAAPIVATPAVVPAPVVAPAPVVVAQPPQVVVTSGYGYGYPGYYNPPPPPPPRGFAPRPGHGGPRGSGHHRGHRR